MGALLTEAISYHRYNNELIIYILHWFLEEPEEIIKKSQLSS